MVLLLYVDRLNAVIKLHHACLSYQLSMRCALNNEFVFRKLSHTQSGSNDHHSLARQQLQRHLARLSGASALGWLCSLAIARKRSPLLAVLCGVPCTLAANLALKYALKTRSFALVATVAVGVGAVLLKW
jgi:hypothetical protein